MLGRYGHCFNVSEARDRAETVVLSASHAHTSGPVLNFPRLLLAGGAAAARRRTSSTYQSHKYVGMYLVVVHAVKQ